MTGGDDPPDLWRVLRLNSAVPDIAAVRRWAESALSDLHEDDLLDVLLVITELVTNVYDHARFPARLKLHQSLRPCVVRITVEDASPLRPVLRSLSLNSFRGRGMILVDKLSERWGIAQRAVGKSVWAVMPCPATA